MENSFEIASGNNSGLFYITVAVSAAIDQGNKIVRYHLHDGLELSYEELKKMSIADIMKGDTLTVRIERTINDKITVAGGSARTSF